MSSNVSGGVRLFGGFVACFSEETLCVLSASSGETVWSSADDPAFDGTTLPYALFGTGDDPNVLAFSLRSEDDGVRVGVLKLS